MTLKLEIAVRGWVGMLGLGAVLLAPPVLAAEPSQCMVNCNTKAATTMQACTSSCSGKSSSPKYQKCIQGCAEKLTALQSKCAQGCSGKKKKSGADHDH
ncbi:hypothetical protein G4177_19245 [Corallococcus sp. ZKHCc1 1396]|uniref:Cys-rich protein n=1 Tax=Corallococcus soli TaxID=2710757 RepID=A0ABR9PQU5_9BACT|nr:MULTISPECIES: hypothetical protein [Corallococcus]MBE4750305.1 hypothetical protein [Corallococcus soli]MCY1032873.1 hypothetical protein [Corallococcus sp. BB11-1]RYZ44214.1 MAG: hypothetical protein EOO72_06485 [Myxococcaceae bacterium]